MILAVTGHRPPKLGGYDTLNPIRRAVQEGIQRAFESYQPELVYLGMALGADQWAAQVCEMMNLRFVACIPFLGYESRWPERSKSEYRRLLNVAYDVIFVSRGNYAPRLMQLRNEFMVDRAARLFAVWNGVQDGGTWNCIRYAQRVGKPVDRINLPGELWQEAARIEALYENQRLEREARQIVQAAPLLLPAREPVPPPPLPPPLRQPLPAPTRLPQLGGEEFMQQLGDMMRDVVVEAAANPRAIAVDDRVFLGNTDIEIPETGEENLPFAVPEPTPAKELIEPEKRFIPGRLLDFDD